MTILFAVAAMRCKNLSIIWVTILSAVSSIATSKDAAFIPCLKPKARQGMNSTGLLAKVLLHRTNEFFSPHSEDFLLVTRLQPGNVDPEALPPLSAEAEPLDMGSQAQPGNQLKARPRI